MLALPLTIPLIILTVNVSAFVSFSTWVCLAYGAFFGMLFSVYEFRHRKHGKFTMAGKAGADKTWNDYLNGTQHTPVAKTRGGRHSRSVLELDPRRTVRLHAELQGPNSLPDLPRVLHGGRGAPWLGHLDLLLPPWLIQSVCVLRQRAD